MFNQWRVQMTRITSFVAALAFVASASVAAAGGLGAPEQDDEVIVVQPAARQANGLGVLPVLGLGLLLVAAASSNSSGSH
jgi:hypothetical protein